MSQGASMFFNVITMVFVTLTVIVGIVVLSVLSDSMEAPFWAAKDDTTPLPTFASDVLALSPSPFLASWTPSNTPVPTATITPTPTVTHTPTTTNTATLTPTATDTPGPTASFTPLPTETPIPPTDTPTATLTFTPSPTFTFTPSPTGPSPTPTNTLSPYPFVVQQGTPVLRENFLNGLGCNWQGFAGQVINERGEAIVGVQVRVTGDGIGELFTITGTNTAYGPSGWEQAVSNQPNNGRYRVDLWSGGVQVSPTVEIVFPNSCQQNLVMINFVQTRPF